jgi:hypothetical protein
LILESKNRELALDITIIDLKDFQPRRQYSMQTGGPAKFLLLTIVSDSHLPLPLGKEIVPPMAISIAPSADGDVVEMAELIAERCVTVITDS